MALSPTFEQLKQELDERYKFDIAKRSWNRFSNN